MTDQYRKFNNFRNVEKAINGLKGILAGLTADRKMNDQEVLFLDVWLRSQSQLKDDGDVFDLLDLIGDILRDGVVDQEELDDLKALCSDILNYKKTHAIDADGAINEFLGVLQGVTADGRVNLKEFGFIKKWIDNHKDLQAMWPIDAVLKRVIDITEDDQITDGELLEFAEAVKLITGNRFDETGAADGSVTEFLQDNLESIHFDGTFCFTGKFVSGPRRVVEGWAVEKGGKLKDGVSQQVDYLVIGAVANKDWMFSSHGRKIEAAVQLRNAGHPIKILSEKRWLELAL